MAKLFLFFIFLISCTSKFQGPREGIKTNRFENYDIESVYLYVPSTLGTSRKISTIRPFYKGSELLVKLKWTEDGLSVFSSDEDARFDLSHNQNPVFTIPGIYKDYKCPGNNDDECLVEDNSKSWEKRQYFFPDFDKIDFRSSLNILDLTLDDAGCFVERGSNVSNYEIKMGVINFEIEKEFVVSKNDKCLAKYLFTFGLKTSDLSFKTTFFYSLVRLKDLASADYIPRPYLLEEQKTFGFFKNTQQNFDENFYQKIENTYINRWNPKRKKISYHLSESFYLKESGIFKELTQKVFEDLNKIFSKENIPIALELLSPHGSQPGDLRFNMINLITDPYEDNLIGYGPVVSNPLTGEILSASVNVYSATLKKIVPKIYKGMQITAKENVKVSQSFFTKTAKSLELSKRWPRKKTEIELTSTVLPSLNPTSIDPRVVNNSDFYSDENIKEGSRLGSDSYLKKLEFLTKNNAYPVELYLNGGRGRKLLDEVLEYKEIWNQDKTLKNWEILNSEQKRKITNMILPHVYRTILIHELGHNFGLRHNLMGSVDKKNAYGESDLKTLPSGKKSLMGIQMDYYPSFSSIMDYGYSEINELPIFGKYDIAALKFAYKGEVENEKGEFIKLEDVKGILLKKYQYCSDEEIGSSVFCNYFDEGSTFSEIMQHYSKKYEDLFELVNFRNIQENYNILDNSGYLFFKDAQFERIRKIFETWEVFADQEIFDLKDAPIKDQRLKIQKKLDYCRENKDPKCQFILDLDNATTLAGKFFLKILKTPNHQCLVKFQKSEIIIPLSFLHRVLALPYAPKSCFDSIIPTITDKGEVGVIVGERGRFLSDSPEYNPKYTMNTDLSARGIWIDKLLAVKYLVGRNLSVNRYRDPHLSFLDHPVIGPEIEEFVEDLITQEPLDKPTPFRDKIGRIIKTNQKISRIILSGNNNSLIPQQISLSLIYSLNLPLNSSFFLSTAILKALIGNSEVGDPTLLRKGEEFQLKLGVKRVEEQIILDTNKFFPEIVLSDGKKYFGSKDFKLASKIISDLNYFNFLENYRPLRDYLEKYDPPSTQEKIFILLSKIYYLKMNPYLDISLRGKTFADPFSGLEGPQKIALEFSANILEKIKNIFELPEAEFLMKFSNEDPNLKIPERALFLKNNLSKEQIEKSREFLLESYKPGTDFAFGELYDLNEPDLNRLLNLTGTKVRVEIEDLLKNLRPY